MVYKVTKKVIVVVPATELFYELIDDIQQMKMKRQNIHHR